MKNTVKFTMIRANSEARTLSLQGMTPEAMIESVNTEMKSKPVSKFRNELPIMESLGAGFVRQALQKLPRISITGAWRKRNTSEMVLSRYNGLVLLNVSKLANAQEVETV